MLRPLRTAEFLYNAYNTVICRSGNKVIQSIDNNFLQCQMINISAICRINPDAKEKTKLPKTSKITLIYPDNSETVSFLDEAEKIAKRRGFQLRKMENTDSKFDRNVYKLYDNAQLINEDQDNSGSCAETGGSKKKMKSTKLFPIQSKISEHDLNVKINNVNRLLDKRHRIKLLLNCTAEEKEKMLQDVKKKVKGVLAEERPKNHNVILVYHPIENKSDCREENIVSSKNI